MLVRPKKLVIRGLNMAHWLAAGLNWSIAASYSLIPSKWCFWICNDKYKISEWLKKSKRKIPTVLGLTDCSNYILTVSFYKFLSKWKIWTLCIIPLYMVFAANFILSGTGRAQLLVSGRGIAKCSWVWLQSRTCNVWFKDVWWLHRNDDAFFCQIKK